MQFFMGNFTYTHQRRLLPQITLKEGRQSRRLPLSPSFAVGATLHARPFVSGLIATLAHAVMREDAGGLEAGVRRSLRRRWERAYSHRGCPLSGGSFTRRTRGPQTAGVARRGGDLHQE
jgi:hypothetical protein